MKLLKKSPVARFLKSSKCQKRVIGKNVRLNHDIDWKFTQRLGEKFREFNFRETGFALRPESERASCSYFVLFLREIY